MNNTNANVHTHQASELLTALANQNRLKVMLLLRNTERTVGELCSLVGLAQSPLSQHLAKLRTLQLVATRRDGQSIYYQINCSKAEQILDLLEKICPDTSN